ncbi:MAG: transposase [Chloroflexi bacterium]|nr:transposase [Chloroflexota bacterium]
MPRRDDIFAANNVYHLYNRGVNRANIFTTADNYIYLLRKVKSLLTEIPATMIAYCLMPNHYHFVMRQEGEIALSQFIARLFQTYTQAYNRQQNRTGPLFAGRFRCIQIDSDEYLIHLCRYVHLNPVAAGLVAKPEDWPYSNYLEWIGRRQGTLVDRDLVKGYFATPEAYINFVRMEPPVQIVERLRPYLLEE